MYETAMDSLLGRLAELTTPELIVESAKLRCQVPLRDTDRKRLRLAFGGAYAVEKVLYYLQTLREVDEQRIEIGKDIHRLLALSASEDAVTAVRARVTATHLSGFQEVRIH